VAAECVVKIASAVVANALKHPILIPCLSSFLRISKMMLFHLDGLAALS
jgi:hypothetical protein